MEERSHVTLKEASEIIGFPYPALKGLFEYAGIEAQKQGTSWIYKKDDVESVNLALKIGFKYADACEIEKGPARIAGFFTLADGSKEDAKFCPHCGSDRISIQRRINQDETVYAFVKCKDCRSSSGSSMARAKENLAECERDAVANWNKRC